MFVSKLTDPHSALFIFSKSQQVLKYVLLILIAITGNTKIKKLLLNLKAQKIYCWKIDIRVKHVKIKAKDDEYGDFQCIGAGTANIHVITVIWAETNTLFSWGSLQPPFVHLRPSFFRNLTWWGLQKILQGSHMADCKVLCGNRLHVIKNYLVLKSS